MTIWRNWFKSETAGRANSEYDKARDLLAALDRGGLPLHPSRINEIARDLGLEVSRKAPLHETIERIRAALKRHDDY
jgi:hypothetical protein